MANEQTTEIIALVQAGNLEGASAAIKKMMDAKRDTMLGEAKVFIGNSVLNGEGLDEYEEQE